MTNAETIKAIDAEIKRQEADLQRLCEEKAAIVQEENHVDKLFDAVLNCPHSITHESVTLHFYPRQKEGHNALSQLRHRLAAADLAARQREMQLLSEIEALERLALANLKQRESRSALIDSASRIQKYLDRLATAKRYNQECIHSFLEGGDTETSLLVSDLKALLQFASATISTTTHPSDEQLDDINVADMHQVFDSKGAA